MIKFFRRIRFDLMEQNKTGKYLKYAIGEIVLVVIGILIALQINNWNEERKFKSREITMLIQIKASLEESLREANQMIKSNGDYKDSYIILLNHINQNLPYDTHFGLLDNWASPFFNYSAYETLKNLGADIITNDSLKNKIIRMYDRDLVYLVSDYDKSEWNYSISVVQPFCSKHLESDIESRNAFPNNYTELKKNTEFKNILTGLIAMRSGGIKASKELKESLEDLIKDMSKEIKRKTSK